MSHYIQVYGRLRPSANDGCIAVKALDSNRIHCEGFGGKEEKIQDLHRVFDTDCDQEAIFATVAKKIVDDCAEGINGTVFAYGQTGSGKTHTMLGPANSWTDSEKMGLIPRSVNHLFARLDEKCKECQKFSYEVVAEFVEIYNEVIFDLLDFQQKKISYRDTGVEVQLNNVQSEFVDNYIDLMNLVRKGWENRKTGETAMNRDSSRSHALLIIKIRTEELTGTILTTRTSILNLVDLAGSERQSHTKASGERLKEATHINGSLSVLGRCIRELSKPEKSRAFIPYRDSVLTHILKNSLGGNSKTAVIVNMHPDRAFLAETTSTLQFAAACSMIKNHIRKNECMSGDKEEGYKEAIRLLRKENDEIEAKVRAEFAKRLADMDTERKNQHQVILNSNKEMMELRAKYEILLLKGLGAKEIDAETLKKYTASRFDGNEQKTIEQRMNTLLLEFAAKNEEMKKLETENADLRTRLSEIVNESLCNASILRTPRRRSSRNPRRETLYVPSPSRTKTEATKVVADHGECEEQIKEIMYELEQVRAENQALDATLKKTIESKMGDLNESAAKISKLEDKLCAISDELEEQKMLYAELEGKHIRAGDKLEKLLTVIASKDDQINEKDLLLAEKSETILDVSKELDKMQKYYTDEIEKLNKQIETIAEERNEALKKLTIQLENTSAEKNQLMIDVSNSKKTAEEAARMKEAVEQLTKELENSTLEKNRLALDVANSKNAMEDARELKDVVEKTRKELEKVVEEKNQIAGKAKELEDTVEKMNSKLEIAVEHRKALENEQENNKKMLESVQKSKEKLLADYETKLKKSTAIIQAKDKTIAALENAVATKSNELKEALQNQIEESSEEVERWKREADSLRSMVEERRMKHTRDIEELRARKQEEVKNLQLSLDREQAAHERTRANALKSYNEKVKKLGMEMIQERKELVKQHEEEVARRVQDVIEQFESKMRILKQNHDDDLEKLKLEISTLNELHMKDAEQLQALTGHNNKGQKINYIWNMRNRLKESEIQLKKLQHDNDELRKQLQVQVPKTEKRVLRSSNAL
ncbi:unnamed protein product [Caenorhabditis bovis]|uniref:Kinesin motor domain-containing protein n=1 Tax=Caenorhabditis bovis TaxID=2654633 RepID=A0A8S1EJX9_9PELO|nr:unnamed protein product [Caenorhabditis bovis]